MEVRNGSTGGDGTNSSFGGVIFGWPCVELGVELDDLCGSLPTQYDSMEKLQYRLHLLEELLAVSN